MTTSGACGTVVAALLGTLAFGSPARAQPADLILHNGKIATVDRDFSTAQAVAIRGERFVVVGDNAAALKEAGPNTQVIDLAGRTVVPGLIDTHLHQAFGALNLPAVKLLDARSVADVQKAIAERATQTPPGQWVIASSGWHESLLKEGRLPTRYELDEVSPNHPVFIPRGGHVVTANSKALELAGIKKDTRDPKGGVIVKDPGTGEPTGVLLETAAYFVRRILPPPPAPAEHARLLKETMRELNSYGIVSVVDPGVDERVIQIYSQLRDAGEMTVRTDVLYRALTKEQVQKGLAQASLRADNMLRFAGIKFPLDGGVEGARLYEPYQIVPGEQPDPNYRGVLLLPPGGEDEYVEGLKLAAAANVQVQTHAVGDETIDVIVRAYERVNAETPIKGRRWTIMHVFLPTDAAIRKMADLGIIATAQDHPVLLGHNQRRWWGDKRAAYAIPIRSLLDAGVHVGGGTDGPVVPVDPFLSLWWMTTRGTLSGYKLGPEQAITPREALQLYTINNAVVMGVERERGSIEIGKLADLAVLSQDILSVPRDEIRNTKAMMTLVGGRIVHRAGM
jgi:predicted amidohydrolase YtcJ